jgi:predicted transcriptional regulator
LGIAQLRDGGMTKLDSVSHESDFSLSLGFARGANSRKKILKMLLSGAKGCNEIAIGLGLNWRTAYRHLQILKKEDLVKIVDFGQRKFYQLTLKGEEAIRRSIKSKTKSKIKKEDTQSSCCLNNTENTRGE